jgi:hypothetical protein
MAPGYFLAELLYVALGLAVDHDAPDVSCER